MAESYAEMLDGEAFAVVQKSAETGPVVMLNLLRFKPDGGAESYDAYGAAVVPLLNAVGADIVYAGRPNELLIGSDRWDLMLLVRYPTRGAFIRMVTSSEYSAIAHLREEALLDSVLYATDPLA